LICGDILFVLQNGTVRSAPTPSDAEGFFRYKIEARTPTSKRIVVVTVVPEPQKEIKIMDVMWKGER